MFKRSTILGAAITFALSGAASAQEAPVSYTARFIAGAPPSERGLRDLPFWGVKLNALGYMAGYRRIDATRGAIADIQLIDTLKGRARIVGTSRMSGVEDVEGRSHNRQVVIGFNDRNDIVGNVLTDDGFYATPYAYDGTVDVFEKFRQSLDDPLDAKRFALIADVNNNRRTIFRNYELTFNLRPLPGDPPGPRTNAAEQALLLSGGLRDDSVGGPVFTGKPPGHDEFIAFSIADGRIPKAIGQAVTRFESADNASRFLGDELKLAAFRPPRGGQPSEFVIPDPMDTTYQSVTGTWINGEGTAFVVQRSDAYDPARPFGRAPTPRAFVVLEDPGSEGDGVLVGIDPGGVDLGADIIRANAINNLGQVVGQATFAPNGTPVETAAFLWQFEEEDQEGVAVNLEELLVGSNAANIRLSDALDITDYGQIVAHGCEERSSGSRCGTFLLDPVIPRAASVGRSPRNPYRAAAGADGVTRIAGRAVASSLRYFDPPLAQGFTYAAVGQRILGVQVPYEYGDGQFDLELFNEATGEFERVAAALRAREIIDLEDHGYSDGVSRLRISGIELDALDPMEPSAFVIGLRFGADGNVVVEAQPSGGDALLIDGFE